MKNVIFSNCECKVEINQYQDSKRVSIKLVSTKNDSENDLFEGMTIATATVNMHNMDIFYDQLIIKDYSENKGMLKALEEAGIVVINENTQAQPVGSGSIVIVDMSPEFYEIIKEDNRFAKKEDCLSEYMDRFLNLACSLSPENITSDGEATQSEIDYLYNEIMTEWHQLERKVGKKVTEEEVYDWQEKNQKRSFRM